VTDVALEPAFAEADVWVAVEAGVAGDAAALSVSAPAVPVAVAVAARVRPAAAAAEASAPSAAAAYAAAETDASVNVAAAAMTLARLGRRADWAPTIQASHDASEMPYQKQRRIRRAFGASAT